jgi:DNA-binding transcriptional ArsR family regulator
MSEDQLTKVFGALADPTRRQMLKRLAHGETTVVELAEPFDMTLAAVSKHLRVLEGAGLVTRAKAGRFRPARLDPKPLETASKWLGDYAQLWEQSVDALDQYLNALQQLSSVSAEETDEGETHD